MKLTLAKLSEWNPGKDLRLLEEANVDSRDISDIEDLSSCIELRRLLLSRNKLNQLTEGIGFMTSLTYLDVSHNQLKSLGGIQRLSKLNVLNASHNELESIGFTEKLVNLKALILNHNKICVIENLGHMKELNTLILSHNTIEKVQGLKGLKNLKKLSLAHNRIRELPSLDYLVELKELRLNHNKLVNISQRLVYNSRLELIDLGSNLISDIQELNSLKPLIHLNNVNIQGNPLCEHEMYHQKLKELISNLKILDGKRVDGFKSKKRRHPESYSDNDPKKPMSSKRQQKTTISESVIPDQTKVHIEPLVKQISRDSPVDESTHELDSSENLKDVDISDRPESQSIRRVPLQKKPSLMTAASQSGIVNVIEERRKPSSRKNDTSKRRPLDPSMIDPDEDYYFSDQRDAWT